MYHAKTNVTHLDFKDWVTLTIINTAELRCGKLRLDELFINTKFGPESHPSYFEILLVELNYI